MTDEVNIKWKVDDRELDGSAQKLKQFGPAADGAMKSAGGGISGLLGGISQVGFAVFGLQQTFMGLKSVVGGLFSSNLQFEQMEVQFGVLLGSADAAKERMNELAEFGKNTPFELPGVVNASKILQTFGGDLLATGDGLTLVGDVAAGVGRPIDELALWFGRLYDGLQSGRPVGEAMARLQEMGAMSGATRGEIEAMSAAGVDGAIVWDTFAESMGKYSGMMDAQSKTVGGAMSNISDGIGMMKRNLMAGLFEAAKPGIMAFAGWLGSEGVQGAVKSAGIVMGDFVTGAVKLTADGFKLLWDVSAPVRDILGELVGQALKLVDPIKTLAGVIVELYMAWVQFAWGKIFDFFRELPGVIRPAVEWLIKVAEPAEKVRILKDAFIDLGAAFRTAFDDFDVAEKFRDLSDSIASLSLDDFLGVWEGLVDALQPAIDILRPLAEDVLVSLKDAVAPISKAFNEDLLPALKGLEPAGKALLPLFEGIGKILGIVIVANLAILLLALKGFIEILTVGIVLAIKGAALLITGFGKTIELLSPVVVSVSNAIVPAFNAIKGAGETTFNSLKSVVETFSGVWTFAKHSWDIFWAAIEVGFAAFKVLASGAFDHVKNVIETGLGVIKGLFDVFAGLLTGDWGRMWDGLKEAAGAIWDGLKELVRINLETIQGLIRDVGPKLYALGKEVFQALLDGLHFIWNTWIVPFIKSFASQVVGFIPNPGGILLEVGRAIMNGLWDGLKAVWTEITNWFTAITDQIPDWKGPIDKDRQLLVPTGKAIMEGLGTGLESGWIVVGGMLQRYTQELADAALDMANQAKAAAVGVLEGIGGGASGDGAWAVTPAEGFNLIPSGHHSGQLMPDDMSKVPIGYYNPSSNMTWTGTGWMQGSWWKPGDQDVAGFMSAAAQRNNGGGVQVTIGQVIASDSGAAETAGRNIGYGIGSQLMARGG